MEGSSFGEGSVETLSVILLLTGLPPTLPEFLGKSRRMSPLESLMSSLSLSAPGTNSAFTMTGCATLSIPMLQLARLSSGWLWNTSAQSSILSETPRPSRYFMTFLRKESSGTWRAATRSADVHEKSQTTSVHCLRLTRNRLIKVSIEPKAKRLSGNMPRRKSPSPHASSA